MGKEALLVIDMLNDFVEKGAVLEVPSARKIIPQIKKRIEEARKKQIKVIYVCDAHQKNDKEFQNWPPHAILGTHGAEIIEELKPGQEDLVVKKRRYSGFFGTDLDLLLRELEIKKIYIVGILTNICVFFTAVDASVRGYEVTIYADSVATISEREHKFALRQLKDTFKIKVTE